MFHKIIKLFFVCALVTSQHVLCMEESKESDKSNVQLRHELLATGLRTEHDIACIEPTPVVRSAIQTILAELNISEPIDIVQLDTRRLPADYPQPPFFYTSFEQCDQFGNDITALVVGPDGATPKQIINAYLAATQDISSRVTDFGTHMRGVAFIARNLVRKQRLAFKLWDDYKEKTKLNTPRMRFFKRRYQERFDLQEPDSIVAQEVAKAFFTHDITQPVIVLQSTNNESSKIRPREYLKREFGAPDAPCLLVIHVYPDMPSQSQLDTIRSDLHHECGHLLHEFSVLQRYRRWFLSLSAQELLTWHALLFGVGTACAVATGTFPVLSVGRIGFATATGVSYLAAAFARRRYFTSHITARQCSQDRLEENDADMLMSKTLIDQRKFLALCDHIQHFAISSDTRNDGRTTLVDELAIAQASDGKVDVHAPDHQRVAQTLAYMSTRGIETTKLPITIEELLEEPVCFESAHANPGVITNLDYVLLETDSPDSYALILDALSKQKRTRQTQLNTVLELYFHGPAVIT